MAIAGKVGQFYRQTIVASVPFTAAAMSQVTGTGITPYTRYQITDTTKRYWDPTQTVTVKKNGTVVTTGYTVELLSGFVVFTAANIVTDTITVSASALDVEPVGGVFQWKLDIDATMEDVTTFTSGGNKEFIATLNGFSGSADAYWLDVDAETLMLAGDTDIILVLYTDAGAGKARYEGFVQFKKISADASVKSVVKKTIDFEGDGVVYYRAG
jgi:predicted RNA-binding protein with TRAM domain